MRLYFCWEKTWTGSWQPVVYHNDKPLAKSSNGQTPERTSIELVPDEAIANGEPIFGKLTKLFPAPLVP